MTRSIIAAIIYLIIHGMGLFYAMLHYSPALSCFVVSFGTIFIINIKALLYYIRHLVWIDQINFNGPVTEIQAKLTRLQLSIFRHNRIMAFQFPF